MLGDTWERKFEIVCRLVANRNAFQETLKGPFPVPRNWCRLHRIRGVARGWWDVVVVVIYGIGQVSVIKSVEKEIKNPKYSCVYSHVSRFRGKKG